jgi:hypothetical protein
LGGFGGEMKRADTPVKAWAVYLSGLGAATLAAAGTRPLSVRHPGSAIVGAAAWLVTTFLAGGAGLGLGESLVERGPAFPSLAFAAGAATTWALIPPLVLFWMHGSGWAAVTSGLGGAAMAACLWGHTLKPENPDAWEPRREGPVFADLPAPDSGRARAFAIAVCVEFAVVLASRGEIVLATALMGVAGFLFVWKRLTSLNAETRDDLDRSAARASAAAVIAMLILIPLLLARFAQVNGVETRAQAATRTDTEKRNGADTSPDGYRGIVLFTVKDKSKDLPPVPVERDLLRAGKSKPLVIPFDGSYWYFQTTQHGPGLHPHLTHGDPVAASIYSTGWVPLAMQAHQTLTQPVDLRAVGDMTATIRNGDNRRGRIDMGILLTDSTAPGKPSMYLGTQPVVSTEPEHFNLKATPVSEDVRFAIPDRRSIRKFDEVTVFFFPNGQRETVGARVGIEQFELTPGSGK